MNEELEILKLVTKRLDTHDIPYMVTGSVAMNMYATPRMTRDIDIVVEISEEDASLVVELFGADFYVDKQMIIDAVRTQRMFNIIHNEYVIKVDFIVRKNSPYRKVEFGRRYKVRVDSVPIWMVSPEDLIISKLWWAKDSRSEMQMTDVRNILRQTKEIDNNYLGKWIRELKLMELYKELSGE